VIPDRGHFALVVAMKGAGWGISRGWRSGAVPVESVVATRAECGSPWWECIGVGIATVSDKKNANDKKAAAGKEPAAEHGDEAAAKPRKGKGKLVLASFVGLVIIAETGLFFFLVPTADEVAALAEARLVQQLQEGSAEKQAEADEENKTVELDLGTFGVTFSPPDTERQFRCEFHLFGTLQAKDEAQLNSEVEAKAGRIRHAIMMVVRTSKLDELQENQLGLIQRRILATCNQLMEEPLLQAVGFQDYQILEE
jgi:flagellar basal body-associated protein FliL